MHLRNLSATGTEFKYGAFFAAPQVRGARVGR
jgi:hypothetical protein